MALAPRFHTVIAGPARKNDPQVIEAIMAAAVKPGSLVMLDSTGKLAVHNVAGGAGVATDQVLFFSREKITVGAEAQLVKVRKSGKATA